ncbi:MAG: glutaconate CoA-transferase subunit A [Clostridium sp.]|jgi:glutaconate CoA-transferase subunit A
MVVNNKMIDKVITLEEAAKLVQDGNTVALGGNVLHRAPMAFSREIIRQSIKQLKLVKTAGAHEVDILCAAGCVQSVDAGFISYETEYGLANHYRKAVQSGLVKGNEHACYTVISALRAAAYGVPFMPVKGLMYGDLLAYNDYFKVVEDPFSSEPITLVKAISPDVGVIHVQECDVKGNCRIYGPKFEDILISRACKKLIVTTEQIVPESKMAMNAEMVDIPFFLVSAIVHVKNGAAPCSCAKKYEIDKSVLNKFIAMKDIEGLDGYLKAYEANDRKAIGRRL